MGAIGYVRGERGASWPTKRCPRPGLLPSLPSSRGERGHAARVERTLSMSRVVVAAVDRRRSTPSFFFTFFTTPTTPRTYGGRDSGPKSGSGVEGRGVREERGAVIDPPSKGRQETGDRGWGGEEARTPKPSRRRRGQRCSRRAGPGQEAGPSAGVVTRRARKVVRRRGARRRGGRERKERGGQRQRGRAQVEERRRDVVTKRREIGRSYRSGGRDGRDRVERKRRGPRPRPR